MRPLHVFSFIAVFLIGVFPFGAGAQTLSGLTLSPEVYTFDYDEDLGAVGNESDGFIYGLGAGYTFRFDYAWFLRFKGRYAQGDAEVTSFGTTLGTSSQKFYEGAIEWGRDFEFEGTITVAPFIGVGYRRWDDESADLLGYDRVVNYWYLQVGLTAYIGLGSRWVIAARGEVQILLDGSEKDSFTGGSTLDFDLTSGYGVAGEFLFRKRLSERFAISFGPFMRYWSIDTSNLDTLGLFFIPPNTTMETGMVFKINI